MLVSFLWKFTGLCVPSPILQQIESEFVELSNLIIKCTFFLLLLVILLTVKVKMTVVGFWFFWKYVFFFAYYHLRNCKLLGGSTLESLVTYVAVSRFLSKCVYVIAEQIIVLQTCHPDNYTRDHLLNQHLFFPLMSKRSRIAERSLRNHSYQS